MNDKQLDLHVRAKTYSYIIRSAEIDIVAVYSGRARAIKRACLFAENQGVQRYSVEEVNDQLINIKIISAITPCKVWIERHLIK